VSSRPNPLVIALAFAVLCAIWGEFPIAAKVGTEGQPPFLVAGVRFILAGLLLGGVAAARGASLRLDTRYLGVLFLISTAMIGFPSAVFFIAVQHAQASVLTLTWSTAPLFISVLNIGNAREGQNLKTLCGLLAGFGGVALVIVGGGGLSFSGGALPGELAVAGSALVYAIGFQQVRAKTGSGDVLVLTSWQLMFAGVTILGLSLASEHRFFAAPSAGNLTSFAFLVIGASCITFSLTNWLIRHLGTVRTGYNSLITPALTVLLAVPQLGEPLSTLKLMGLALEVGGLVLVMPRERREHQS
jgi:drug/metabolite transporter (DMT)-like permease